MTITDLHPVEPPSDTEPQEPTLNTFNFTYPFSIMGVLMAEWEGRCMVNYFSRFHSPDLLAELEGLSAGEWAAPDGLLKANVLRYLWENHEDDINQFQPRSLADRPPRESWA